MKLSWEIDGVDVDLVVDKLEDGIEAGMERAVDDIIDIISRNAVDTIRLNDRIFTKELIRSFDDWSDNADIKDGHHARVSNVARHAGAVEYGVHRSKYADGGPPISALMPWVIANLQGWNLSDGGDLKSGNSLKQSVVEESANEITKNLDLFNTIEYTDTILQEDEKDILESSMKSSSLDDTSIDALFNQHKSWKIDSKPSGRFTEEVVQYSSDVKETFGIEGTIRGTDLYTPEPTYEETQNVLKTLNEISKAYAYNHYDNGDGTISAGRWTGVTEMSLLGKEFWEDPNQSEWTIDNNIVRNYSTEPRRIRSMFNKGLRHDEREIDIEDDLLFLVDALSSVRNNQESEVHLRGGDGTLYEREDLTLTPSYGMDTKLDSILDDDFENANFSIKPDDDLLALASIIKAMGEKNQSVDTQIARDRINAWLDEFLARGLYAETGTDDYKWEQYVDRITG